MTTRHLRAKAPRTPDPARRRAPINAGQWRATVASAPAPRRAQDRPEHSAGGRRLTRHCARPPHPNRQGAPWPTLVPPRPGHTPRSAVVAVAEPRAAVRRALLVAGASGRHGYRWSSLCAYCHDLSGTRSTGGTRPSPATAGDQGSVRPRTTGLPQACPARAGSAPGSTAIRVRRILVKRGQ